MWRRSSCVRNKKEVGKEEKLQIYREKQRRRKQFKKIGERREGILLTEVAPWKQGFVPPTSSSELL